MEIKNSALVLEGGAMRCLFTAGVLDVLMEHELWFPYVIGTSAGSLSGANYIAKQVGRTARINIRFAHDKRYYGVTNLVREHSLFNFDYLFGTIGMRLEPMDLETFYANPTRFTAVSTNCATGEAFYHEKGKCENIFQGIRASSSIPVLAPMVETDGAFCLDGGVADPIPYKRPMAEGYRPVLVLTRDQGFRQKEQISMPRRTLFQRSYAAYPEFSERLLGMPSQYNRIQQEIDALEAAGEVFIIRPQKPVEVSLAERDTEKLSALYEEGRAVCLASLDAMEQYFKSGEKRI